MPQVISVASTGANFGYSVTTVSATPDPSLASGTYFAAIILKSQDGNTAAVVPATLTVAPASAAFFDALPGSLTYSMVTAVRRLLRIRSRFAVAVQMY